MINDQIWIMVIIQILLVIVCDNVCSYFINMLSVYRVCKEVVVKILACTKGISSLNVDASGWMWVDKITPVSLSGCDKVMLVILCAVIHQQMVGYSLI